MSMPRYPMMLVDAFADRPLAGNACAVIFDTDGMDEPTMLAIAREMNLSETAFVRGSRVADAAARYFTPAEEIPLAGHPTIATVFALAATGRVALRGATTRLSLELIEGPIAVEVETEAGAPRRVVMSQRRPVFGTVFEPGEVLPLFGLDPAAAMAGAPPQVVSTGTSQLMVPLAGHEALRRARIDPPSYEAFRLRAGFFSPHLFCLTGATPRGRTYARHLGVPPEPAEDPFTGSATGGMAAYLWCRGLIDSPSFVAEQGHWMRRPGEARVEVIGPRDAIETVRVGGAAVAVLEGTLCL
jgi:trans-2,3-dihydro-3-hydroxyanthranilate isomerase